jgi:hypothetical protein
MATDAFPFLPNIHHHLRGTTFVLDTVIYYHGKFINGLANDTTPVS